jgi:hypothetical protein
MNKANYISIDGFTRSKSEDEIIDQNMASLFGTPTGGEVLRYLRSVTIEAVSGANISDAELRHLEGMRFLVALIERRIATGHKVKSNGKSRSS